MFIYTASVSRRGPSNTSQTKDRVNSRELGAEQQAERKDQTHTDTHRHTIPTTTASISWPCRRVRVLSPVFSVCRGSAHYSLLSQGQTCVNAFSPLALSLSLSLPTSASPLPAFQLTLGFAQLICLPIQINLHLFQSPDS